jgi:endoglucanase
MKNRVLVLLPLVIAGCAGSGAAPLPDCQGDWPEAWVAKEQQFVTALNTLRVAGGTCAGVAFDPVPALSTNPILTQLSRCFARDQALAGANALTGDAADGALRDQVMASGFGGQLLGWAGDVRVASPDEVLAGMLASSAQCPVLFDSNATATTGGVGYVEGPAGGQYRWAGVMASTACTGASADLPVWTRGPTVGRRVDLAGVNLAGPDFGQNVPGVFNIDYTYPTTDEIDYFVARGMNVFRFPFLWERMQPTLNGELDPQELARLRLVVSYATRAGASALLDPHNYARRDGTLIGSDALPDAAFADFWGKLATVFKDDQRAIFGLMNEPHDLGPGGTQRWLGSVNAAIATIRAAAAANLVLVPGNLWTGAWSWTEVSDGASNAQVMAGVVDPGNRFAFEVHQYLDDGSGAGTECVSASIGFERVADFTAWARRTGVRGFLGEFGAPATNTCRYAVDNLLGYLGDNPDVWLGWTWWAAGPWWGDYAMSIEPSSKGDAPQMAILTRYLTPP